MKPKNFNLSKLNSALIVCAAYLFSSTATSQSLEQSIAFAIDNNPNVRVAFTKFKAKEQQISQAGSGYFPTIDLDGSYSYINSDGDISAEAKEDKTRGKIGLTLRQNLFNGFLTSNEVDRTNYEASAEQLQLLNTAENLALQAANVYTDVIKTKQLLQLSEKNLETHKVLFQNIKTRTDSGVGSIADFSQATGRLAKAHSNLIAARNNARDADVAFLKVIGQNPANLVVPVPDGNMLPFDMNEGLKKAIANHPVIKASENDLYAARFQHGSAKSRFYPKVDLSLEAAHSTLDYQDNNYTGNEGYTNEVLATINLSYNLFAGGKDKSYVTETAYQMTQASELKRNAQLQVTEGYKLAWNAYNQLNQQMQYLKEHVVATKETQSAYDAQFRIGQRSLFDLLEIENELYQSRIDYVTARFAEIISQYRLLNAGGILLDSFRLTHPESWNGEKNIKGAI